MRGSPHFSFPGAIRGSAPASNKDRRTARSEGKPGIHEPSLRPWSLDRSTAGGPDASTGGRSMSRDGSRGSGRLPEFHPVPISVPDPGESSVPALLGSRVDPHALPAEPREGHVEVVDPVVDHESRPTRGEAAGPLWTRSPHRDAALPGSPHLDPGEHHPREIPPAEAEVPLVPTKKSLGVRGLEEDAPDPGPASATRVRLRPSVRSERRPIRFGPREKSQLPNTRNAFSRGPQGRGFKPWAADE